MIVGHGPDGDARGAGAASLALGRVGESLLAAEQPWRLRRLAPWADERDAPGRLALKREIDGLAAQRGGSAMLIVVGAATGAGGGVALVAGRDYLDYPEDSTLSLAWVGERVRVCAAERLLVVLSLRPDASAPAGAEAYLSSLRTEGPGHLIVVDAPARGDPAVDELARAFAGAALDPATGTITMASLGAHLARVLPRAALQQARASGTLLTKPPLGRPREPGWSRLSYAPGSGPGAPGPPALEGAVLPGRFQLLEELARGGLGIIYRARQLSVDRDVAIKVLPPGVDPDAEDGRLFVQEIQAVGRIDHPNVVRIYQADVAHDGRLFFAMELLDGRTLQDLADAGPLAPARAIALVRQLLAGLGAAHDAGLVHADVKPANAMVIAGRGGAERLVLLDFGLARLRPGGEAAESVGGTPAYMAPEQLHDGRVDARSDLFSAALVLVTLLTGWCRRRAADLVPPLDDIADAGLREALARALALAPGARFQTAAELSAALAGEPAEHSEPIERPPFRRLTPFTEDDLGHLHGREGDLAALAEHALFRRKLVFTAPSGAGKTSLLRAGLVPRLRGLGAHVVYASCRADPAAALRAALAPDEADPARAVASWATECDAHLVIVLDQLESLLADDPVDAAAPARLLADLLAFSASAPDADLSLVMSVREDFLARLLGRPDLRAEGVPVLRLGPLTLAGAREAIVRPLAERRCSVEPELLGALLADLAAASGRAPRAADAAGGWVHPPHLQLACSALYEALGPGESTLTLAHYRALGGFDAIVGEHLDRVLEAELDAPSAAVARDVFLALITPSQARAARTEAELLEGIARAPADVTSVLEALRASGLLCKRSAAGGPVWELVHDSLVPRVQGWLDRRDLARRQAVELMRHRLRRSRPGAPSALSRAELRELDAHPGALAELDAEWSRRPPGGWTPSALASYSRALARRRLLAGLALGACLASGAAAVALERQSAAAAARREQSLRGRDMGRFTLELAPFAWNAERSVAEPVAAGQLPALDWSLHEPDPDDLDSPGGPVAPSRLSRGAPAPSADGLARSYAVEAPGGSAFLVVRGRGLAGATCAPSIVPLRSLPGYALRDRGAPRLRLPVPVCGDGREMVEVPAGPFLRGGPGEPPNSFDPADIAPEQRVELGRYAIDRTEVTNATYRLLAETGAVPMPVYPPTAELRDAGAPDFPVTDVTWTEARAYCRFFGKALPTNDQWEKAYRGGLTLPDGSENPRPRRNLPPSGPGGRVPARIRREGAFSPAPVGREGDVSPLGVHDLTGNVQEWTSTDDDDDDHFVITRGCNWSECSEDNLVNFVSVPNPRTRRTHNFALGFRCALAGEPSTPD
ncbi:MAG: bifunctional serine/threonine-protein kinase/formylglycine-generating enzyme family protein [Polyangiaceae bacterium]|nr:bifunctional serine/threonine-protein kinase/formylglycine-generating enzyme family protein [Polyangiaceae bacterium]